MKIPEILKQNKLLYIFVPILIVSGGVFGWVIVQREKKVEPVVEFEESDNDQEQEIVANDEKADEDTREDTDDVEVIEDAGEEEEAEVEVEEEKEDVEIDEEEAENDDVCKGAPVNDIYAVLNEPLEDAVFTSSDYLLYPVSKTYPLPSGYAPQNDNLVSVDGFTLRSEAADALGNLMSDAEVAGYTFSIRSAYRSEATQEATFNSWVSKEQAKGYGYNEAVERADAYSARPQHSEHQLGTAVDIVLPRLNNQFTQDMWGTDEVDWLKANAHKYGFVISYPEGKTCLTGYTAEPWHIRWVGEEHARNIYQKGYLETNTSEALLGYLLELRD